MTPNDVIDTVIQVRDGTDSESTANTNRRVQAMHFLNHLLVFVYNYREWSWTWTSAPVTINSGDRTAGVPTLFQEFGQRGGLYHSATKRRYREISIWEMDQLRFTGNAGGDWPVFCVRDDNIEIPFTVTSALSLTAIYRRSAEVITNHSSTTELIIPDRYCRLVIVPGLTRAMQQSKDDARIDWASELRDGLSVMCAQDNPQKSGVVRWPIGIPGAW